MSKYTTTNPTTGQIEREFPTLQDSEVEGILARSHAAYDGWRSTSPQDRAKVLADEVRRLLDAARTVLDPDEYDSVERAVRSDAAAWAQTFGVAADVSALPVERNVLRYRPAPVVVRAGARASEGDLLRVVATYAWNLGFGEFVLPREVVAAHVSVPMDARMLVGYADGADAAARALSNDDVCFVGIGAPSAACNVARPSATFVRSRCSDPSGSVARSSSRATPSSSAMALRAAGNPSASGW